MEIRKIVHIQLFILLSAAIHYLGKPVSMTSLMALSQGGGFLFTGDPAK